MSISVETVIKALHAREPRILLGPEGGVELSLKLNAHTQSFKYIVSWEEDDIRKEFESLAEAVEFYNQLKG